MPDQRRHRTLPVYRTCLGSGDQGESQGHLFGDKSGGCRGLRSEALKEGPNAERRTVRHRITLCDAMRRRAQGKARRKAVDPGMLGPEGATPKADSIRLRIEPRQPQGGPGASRTSQWS